MVRTRAQYRLLQYDISVDESEKTVQRSKSSMRCDRRKRKRADLNNDEDEINNQSTKTCIGGLSIQSESDSVTIPSTAKSPVLFELQDQDEKKPINPSSEPCYQYDLPFVLSSEAVDKESDGDDIEDQHLFAMTAVTEPSDLNNARSNLELGLQPQILVDVSNQEENNSEVSLLNDSSIDAFGSENNSLEEPISWPIENNDLQWVKTKKGKECLIMGGHSYIFMSESKKKSALNLRCQRRDTKCGAVIRLNADTRLFIGSNNINRNHPPDPFGMKQKFLNHKIDNMIASEPTSILKVIERVYSDANLTDEEQLNIRLPRTAATSFYKRRSRRYPAHPKTQHFDIHDYYRQNNRGEDFVIYDVHKEELGGRLLMFSTTKLLSALFNSDVVLCDGTFKTRPLLFQQVYVLMGRYHGETIPCVWCLTSSRTQSVYDAIWKKLKKMAKHMHMEWHMSQCMIDFERAMIKSFHEAFPNVDLKCCWYHFVQAIWRKIQKLGISTAYQNDSLVNDWLKQFMALPLISKGLVNDGLQLLKDTIPSNDDAYNKFITYFENEYMRRTSIDLWHHGDNDMKTNNALEGYNFRLFTRFRLHPSIWEFIHFLKEEEAIVSHRITHLGGGSGITSSALIYSTMQSRRRAEKNNKHLSNLEKLFLSKSIGLVEYMKSASLMVGKAVGHSAGAIDADQSTTNFGTIDNEDSGD